MSNERTYYVICGDNCKFESMTKEQILSAITQAVETHEIADVDTGFVTKLKEQNANAQLKFWVGTQAQYNAIATKQTNCIYNITDETYLDDIDDRLTEIEDDIDNIETSLSGTSATVTTLLNNYTGTISFKKIGSLVVCDVNVKPASGYTDELTQIVSSFPTGFAPATNTDVTSALSVQLSNQTEGNHVQCFAEVKNDGIYIKPAGGMYSNYRKGQIIYSV